MRVLFSPRATPQHLYPMVPLAWAARAAGHEVRIAGAPAIGPATVRTGLPAVTVGADIPSPALTVHGSVAKIYAHKRFPPDYPLTPHLLDDDQRDILDQKGRNAATAAEAIVDDLIRYCASWRPDVIVHDTADFVGPVVAAALDVPNVRHLTGVGLQPLEHRVSRFAGQREPLPEFVALFESRGLPPRIEPTLTIDPTPPPLRLPVPEPWLEMRYVPYNGSGAVPDLPERGTRPRVCVSPGWGVLHAALALGSTPLDPYREALHILAGLDVEVVLLALPSHLDLLGELPPGTQVLREAPLHLVLPSCDLLVHQAGDGTALTAAACGTVQLALTQKPDTTLTGDRLAAIGAGIHLHYQDLRDDPHRTELIGSAVRRLLGDASYAAAAERLRARIETQPPPAGLVPALEALAAQTPVPVG